MRYFPFCLQEPSAEARYLWYNISMSYSQLNTLSVYSFGESTITPSAYAKRGKELGYTAIAFADKNLFAYPYFEDACKAEGIKAIFGYRISLSSGRAKEIPACLYIQSEEGYLSLLALLQEKTELYGTHHLSAHSDGLKLVIDCSNPFFFDETFLTAIAPDLFAYQKIFKESFYLGISIKNEYDQEQVQTLYDFLEKTKYKSLAFPSARYIKKTDAGKTYLLSAGLRKEQIDSIPSGGPDFLLSQKALEAIYRDSDLQATALFCGDIDFTFFKRRGALVEEKNADEKLESLAIKGLEHRLNALPDNYMAQLVKELNVIKKMHFSSYFLTVLDYVSFAKRSGIKMGPGRGSAVGSLVVYALGITELDPIKFGFSFERFLNEKRKDLPDIDIDFDSDRRDEIALYIKNRYGFSRTGEILTFTKLKPKSALQLVGKTLGFNENRLKKLTSLIDNSAKDFNEALSSAKYKKKEQLEQMLNDPYYKELCECASSLLGLPVNTSTHAPGLIIAGCDIPPVVPMSEKTKGTLLFEHVPLERMGFIKFDVLAVTTINFISEIEKRLKEKNIEPVDIMQHLDDPESYRVLNNGYFTEIFQFENPGMQKACLTLKPKNFRDLAALLALYRPGPMSYIPLYTDRKEGRKAVFYLHEKLKPILEETYGIMIYQEQVIKIVSSLASFDAGDADLFRRAISKKNIAEMEKNKEKFLHGCTANGIEEKTALAIYADIEKFANYGFNKSHAYAYATISLTLLFYKAHYPEIFYDIAFRGNRPASEKGKALMKELMKEKYRFRNPSIQRSELEDLSFSDRDIYCPLSWVDQTKSEILKAILDERKNGPYTSVYNFTARNIVALYKDDGQTFDALINAGFFDEIESRRESILERREDLMSFARLSFEEGKIPPFKDVDYAPAYRLIKEKNALGVILSKRLKEFCYKRDYKTLIVTDISEVDLNHVLIAESEGDIYHLRLNQKKDYKKYQFILVKGDFKRSWLTPEDIIPERSA